MHPRYNNAVNIIIIYVHVAFDKLQNDKYILTNTILTDKSEGNIFNVPLHEKIFPYVSLLFYYCLLFT